MNWLQFLKRLLINVLLSVLTATLVLGLGGFLLAGREGLINGASWGVLLGTLTGLSMGVLLALQPGYWEDFAGRMAGWWVKHEEPDENPDPERERDQK